MRPAFLTLLLTLAAFQFGCSRGTIGQDTNERLETYDESACESGAGIDFFGLSIGDLHGCSNYFAGEHDPYVGSLRNQP